MAAIVQTKRQRSTEQNAPLRLEEEALMISKYSDRNNPFAALFKYKDHSKGRILPSARVQVVNDLEAEEQRLIAEACHRNTKDGVPNTASDFRQREIAKSNICKHYGIDVRTLERWRKKACIDATISDKPRSGRPPKISWYTKYMMCKLFNEGKTYRAIALGLSHMKHKDANGLPYETVRDGKTSTSPSLGSIFKILKQGKITSLRVRPLLTEKNMRERYQFADRELMKSDDARNSWTVCIDEAWFGFKNDGTGRVVLHPCGPNQSEIEGVRQVKDKGHPCKTMVIAVIARPKMLNMATACKTELGVFDERFNGKVAIFRVVDEEHYKRKVYRIENGMKKLKHDVGDSRFVSVTMDGQRYKRMLCEKGGIFEKIREYFGDDDVEVRLQEDGAPGHGYNNRANGRPSAIHDEIVAEAERLKIKIFKQPANSPEVNPLDLGIWNSLQKKVKSKLINMRGSYDDAYIENRIWEACQDAWKTLEPKKIWNSWMVKDEILKMLIKNKGGPIKSEPHAKIRQRWGTY